MNVLLSLCLWLALIMSPCCGDEGSRETEEPPTDYEDDSPITTTPEYDYNATFDYLDLVDGGSRETEEPPTDYVDYSLMTSTADYDDNATFEYYYVTWMYDPKGKASRTGLLSPVLLLGLAVLLIWH